MKQAYFRFFDDLNDLLAPDQRGREFPLTFNGRQTVKHLIESLGVPHTEVERIQANGRAIDFSYLVRDGDHLQVYPFSGNGAQADPDSLQAPINGEPRFILDIHLGKLARYLRMLGYDTWYRNDYDDPELARLANREERILLTRDRRLLMRNLVSNGYCIRSLDPKQQLIEVLQRFDLHEFPGPFQRCIRCNELLEPVSKGEIEERLEPMTRKYFEEFHICPACKQIYWKGSHYERMQRFIHRALNEETQNGERTDPAEGKEHDVNDEREQGPRSS